MRFEFQLNPGDELVGAGLQISSYKTINLARDPITFSSPSPTSQSTQQKRIKMSKSKLSALSLLTSLSLTTAWLPETDKQITSTAGTNLFSASNGKIRGVNLGSQFVFEPWIAESAWSALGCQGQNSEFDCVSSLGQDAANDAFAKHWASWITQDDIAQMASYGLNTIRVPVGYWLREDLVYRDSEHFPMGGEAYFEKVCRWASDAGMYIIVDLHGAPGAQTPQNAFTGQYADEPGFYQDYQYERALKFLEWMTEKVHGNEAYRNVGMIEVVNEPVQNADQTASMRSSYYPDAFDVRPAFPLSSLTPSIAWMVMLTATSASAPSNKTSPSTDPTTCTSK